jgi:hypothetical protein
MAERKGFNQYEIHGESTDIIIKRRSGEIIIAEIDTYKLQKLIGFNRMWHGIWDKWIKNYYIASCIYLGLADGKPKYETLYLHRFLVDAPDDIYVDHRDHNSLNNRDYNLRQTFNDKNNQNRKGKNINNTSGYRNVSWIEDGQNWRVQLQIDGKNKVLQDFPIDQVHEAGLYAEKMRKELYGEFAGQN